MSKTRDVIEIVVAIALLLTLTGAYVRWQAPHFGLSAPTYEQGIVDGRAAAILESERANRALRDAGLCNYAKLACRERKL